MICISLSHSFLCSLPSPTPIFFFLFIFHSFSSILYFWSTNLKNLELIRMALWWRAVSSNSALYCNTSLSPGCSTSDQPTCEYAWESNKRWFNHLGTWHPEGITGWGYEILSLPYPVPIHIHSSHLENEFYPAKFWRLYAFTFSISLVVSSILPSSLAFHVEINWNKCRNLNTD